MEINASKNNTLKTPNYTHLQPINSDKFTINAISYQMTI
jgi:hypothetical protein